MKWLVLVTLLASMGGPAQADVSRTDSERCEWYLRSAQQILREGSDLMYRREF